MHFNYLEQVFESIAVGLSSGRRAAKARARSGSAAGNGPVTAEGQPRT
jgi:hypothetical protein